MSRRTFFALMLAATLVRLAGLPLHGTEDVPTFQVWTFHAATGPVTHMYGPPGVPGSPLTFNGTAADVDYPPVALFLLGILGRAYQFVFPEFPAGPVLTVAIKLFTSIAGALLAVLIFLAVRRFAGVESARFAAAEYWANPAAILIGPVLGYIGSLAYLPALLSLLVAGSNLPFLAGVLGALSVLTKPQGILIAPAVVVALTSTKEFALRNLRVSAGAAVLTGIMVAAPFIAVGTFGNMLRAVGTLIIVGPLSGAATNFWWLFGYLSRIASRFGEFGIDRALPPNARIVDVTEVIDLPFRIFGLDVEMAVLLLASWPIVFAIVGWAAWRAARATRLDTWAALGGLTVNAYFVFAPHVHENHLSLAIPLLAIVAACDRHYRPVFYALTALIVVNLNLIYGFGTNFHLSLPASVLGIDLSVVSALASIAVLIWHIRVFDGHCRRHDPLPLMDTVTLAAVVP